MVPQAPLILIPPPLIVRLREFTSAHSNAVRFLERFVMDVKGSIDVSTAEFEQMLANRDEIAGLPHDTDNWLSVTNIYGSIVESKKHYPQLLLIMAFIYRVALHDAFLDDLLYEILVANPELLKSNKKSLTYEEIVHFNSEQTLLARMAKKELDGFGYKSAKEQNGWIESRLKVKLVPDKRELAKLVEINERRNLFAHANGIVDERYRRRVPQSKAAIGDRLEVDEEYFEDSDQLLLDIVEDLYVSLTTRYAPGQYSREFHPPYQDFAPRIEMKMRRKKRGT